MIGKICRITGMASFPQCSTYCTIIGATVKIIGDSGYYISDGFFKYKAIILTGEFKDCITYVNLSIEHKILLNNYQDSFIKL